MSSRTETDTLNEVLDLAAAQFRVPRQELSGSDDFFAKLGIDSLQALEMLTRLENHFGVELPDYEMQGVTDFGTLADRIHARL
ncbi:MAG TPA: acyl carrier protein [bacterium]|nr:acyl carrier protein [bacterium]